jgi:hypothetical protein
VSEGFMEAAKSADSSVTFRLWVRQIVTSRCFVCEAYLDCIARLNVGGR